MNKLEQAARQALDALENAYENGFLTGITGLKTIDIITALREALAEQAEQEPVVKYPGCDYCNDELFCGRKCKCCGKVFIEDEDFVQSEVKSLRQQVAALKAVLDAWNNVEQEPVAWIEIERGIPMFVRFADKYKPNCDGFIPLYDAAIRTKDLTPHEITALIREGAADGGWQGFAQRVIAADREKNK